MDIVFPNDDEEKFIDGGCDAYLSKPINTRELPEMIAEMLIQQKKANPEHR